MSDNEPDVQPEHTRKTVSFTHKQLGWGGGSIIAAIMLLDPLKGWFFTREEGLAINANVARIEATVIASEARLTNSINSVKVETSDSIERKFDEIIRLLHQSEERNARTEERLDRRIDSIEFAQSRSKSSTKNN